MKSATPVAHASWCSGPCADDDAPIMMDVQSHAPEADPVGFQAALVRFREKMIADGNEVFETWVPRGPGSGLQHLMRGCEFEIFMDAYESSVNTFFDVIQNGCRK